MAASSQAVQEPVPATLEIPLKIKGLWEFGASNNHDWRSLVKGLRNFDCAARGSLVSVLTGYEDKPSRTMQDLSYYEAAPLSKNS